MGPECKNSVLRFPCRNFNFFQTIGPLDNFSMNLTRKKFKIILSGNDGFVFCPNVTFEADEFKDNKALNDQGF